MSANIKIDANKFIASAGGKAFTLREANADDVLIIWSSVEDVIERLPRTLRQELRDLLRSKYGNGEGDEA